MFLPANFYNELGAVDDTAWQGILDRHGFWRNGEVTRDDEHRKVAFHILMMDDQLASRRAGVTVRPKEEFDAVQIPDGVFDDEGVCNLTNAWAGMHEENCGAGYTMRVGVYVIHPGGLVGYHVDGPVFLKGSRADLSDPGVQEEIIRAHASRRTVLPLRFNDTDEFLVCGRQIPLMRGKLIEFNNVLPHAFQNRGPKHSVLLVTTYLVSELLPRLPVGPIMATSADLTQTDAARHAKRAAVPRGKV